MVCVRLESIRRLSLERICKHAIPGFDASGKKRFNTLSRVQGRNKIVKRIAEKLTSQVGDWAQALAVVAKDLIRQETRKEACLKLLMLLEEFKADWDNRTLSVLKLMLEQTALSTLRETGFMLTESDMDELNRDDSDARDRVIQLVNTYQDALAKSKKPTARLLVYAVCIHLQTELDALLSQTPTQDTIQNVVENLDWLIRVHWAGNALIRTGALLEQPEAWRLTQLESYRDLLESQIRTVERNAVIDGPPDERMRLHLSRILEKCNHAISTRRGESSGAFRVVSDGLQPEQRASGVVAWWSGDVRKIREAAVKYLASRHDYKKYKDHWLMESQAREATYEWGKVEILNSSGELVQLPSESEVSYTGFPPRLRRNMYGMRYNALKNAPTRKADVKELKSKLGAWSNAFGAILEGLDAAKEQEVRVEALAKLEKLLMALRADWDSDTSSALKTMLSVNSLLVLRDTGFELSDLDIEQTKSGETNALTQARGLVNTYKGALEGMKSEWCRDLTLMYAVSKTIHAELDGLLGQPQTTELIEEVVSRLDWLVHYHFDGGSLIRTETLLEQLGAWQFEQLERYRNSVEKQIRTIERNAEIDGPVDEELVSHYRRIMEKCNNAMFSRPDTISSSQVEPRSPPLLGAAAPAKATMINRGALSERRATEHPYGTPRPRRPITQPLTCDDDAIAGASGVASDHMHSGQGVAADVDSEASFDILEQFIERYCVDGRPDGESDAAQLPESGDDHFAGTSGVPSERLLPEQGAAADVDSEASFEILEQFIKRYCVDERPDGESDAAQPPESGDGPFAGTSGVISEPLHPEQRAAADEDGEASFTVPEDVFEVYESVSRTLGSDFLDNLPMNGAMDPP